MAERRAASNGLSKPDQLALLTWGCTLDSPARV
jgi:hypothetical protein